MKDSCHDSESWHESFERTTEYRYSTSLESPNEISKEAKQDSYSTPGSTEDEPGDYWRWKQMNVFRYLLGLWWRPTGRRKLPARKSGSSPLVPLGSQTGRKDQTLKIPTQMPPARPGRNIEKHLPTNAMGHPLVCVLQDSFSFSSLVFLSEKF